MSRDVEGVDGRGGRTRSLQSPPLKRKGMVY